MLVLAIILFGMIVGAGAQLILGRSHGRIDWTMAIVAGLVGSFIGGLLTSLLSGDGLDLKPSGIIGPAPSWSQRFGAGGMAGRNRPRRTVPPSGRETPAKPTHADPQHSKVSRRPTCSRRRALPSRLRAATHRALGAITTYGHLTSPTRGTGRRGTLIELRL
jgi:uncharacterized membrane protein YeaQ/YmgE (transglycosylase-associated protein family)